MAIPVATDAAARSVVCSSQGAVGTRNLVTSSSSSAQRAFRRIRELTLSDAQPRVYAVANWASEIT